TSTEEPHYIEMLPIGRYILHEESAPEGYLVAEDIEFEVKDTGEIQKVVMKDEAAPEETPEEPQNPVGTDAPKTGDDTNLLFWTALLGIGLCGTGAAFVMRRKRR
ncbi:MAG TPA: LPXTG cell wall anchor domain-containing protein, partial [Candidatus Mediterraneibacter merdigallinarum]|nr:LPXTG cell wall anchor domain-containing protein [Candidatus Mediterraneibacter merdigallinarum]